MFVTLQLSDHDYESLLISGHRMQGSIALVSPTEGNFNAYRRVRRQLPGTRFIKLAHGRATVSQEHTRLTLTIDRDEQVRPYDVIDRESQQASDFVFNIVR